MAGSVDLDESEVSTALDCTRLGASIGPIGGH